MEHDTHSEHHHGHGEGCGHTQIRHDNHVDFVHDGHLHNVHGDHVDEHTLTVSELQPADCDESHACDDHAKSHQHGNECGHDAVPHGDHTDYIVASHLHNQHDDHCDKHGEVALV